MSLPRYVAAVKFRATGRAVTRGPYVAVRGFVQFGQGTWAIKTVLYGNIFKTDDLRLERSRARDVIFSAYSPISFHRNAAGRERGGRMGPGFINNPFYLHVSTFSLTPGCHDSAKQSHLRVLRRLDQTGNWVEALKVLFVIEYWK
ncbi:hypothetical protein H6P81_012736 [Aristolochia fimbriata]|uniref:Uncharacterized protein n=1 Tax=Aristolochia fimbriata TaxID=158543 RepID=A0AAV7ECY7_ARIFI|nr:hypothetical protein H6P81_012736 [Aristolochia fimbriata]